MKVLQSKSVCPTSAFNRNQLKADLSLTESFLQVCAPLSALQIVQQTRTPTNARRRRRAEPDLGISAVHDKPGRV